MVNAGEAFAEQLDSRHKVECPWRGNSCVDSLVQFSLTASTLVGGYKDRCDSLLQFSTLPVIASSAIETIRLTRSVQLDHLLSQPPNFLSGELGADPTQLDSSSGYAYVCILSHNSLSFFLVYGLQRVFLVSVGGKIEQVYTSDY